jgi:phosphate uptake regulator
MNGEVTARCRRGEEQGFLLLAREAPVAGNLRRLVSILRLVFAVERSASLLRHVAETLDRVDPRFLPADVRSQVEELAAGCAVVFTRGLEAWRRRDGLAVREIDGLDDQVDTLRDGLLAVAEHRMEGSAPPSSSCSACWPATTSASPITGSPSHSTPPSRSPVNACRSGRDACRRA